MHSENDVAYKARKVPKATSLTNLDKVKRLAYAKHGPILNGGKFGCVNLSNDWHKRKKEIAFGDDKPWWKDSSSVNNRFYYDFGDDEKPPETLDVDKHTPHFMNLSVMAWNSKIMHFYSQEVRPKLTKLVP